MTIVLVIVVATCLGLLLMIGARRRAEQRAAQAQIEKARAARRSRVPEVSNNLKGVTASQTIQPLKPDRADRAA